MAPPPGKHNVLYACSIIAVTAGADTGFPVGGGAN